MMYTIIGSLFSSQRQSTHFSLTMCQNAEHPNVVSVFLNKARKLHTTRSWNFLGLENNGVIHHSSIWKKARFGEDIIIANLDTGQYKTWIHSDRCDGICWYFSSMELLIDALLELVTRIGDWHPVELKHLLTIIHSVKWLA